MIKGKLRTKRNDMNTSSMVTVGSPCEGGVVYGFQFPSKSDVIKIGFSKRGLERIKEQSTGFPEIPNVLFLIHDDNAQKLEKEIHKKLANRQAITMGTEWFKIDFESVVDVLPSLQKAVGRKWWKKLGKQFLLVLVLIFLFLALPIIDVFKYIVVGDTGLSEGLGYISDYLIYLTRGVFHKPYTLYSIFTVMSLTAWILTAGLGFGVVKLFKMWRV